MYKKLDEDADDDDENAPIKKEKVKKYNFKTSIYYVIKADLRYQPYTFVIMGLVFVMILFGFAVRIFEV